MKAKRTRKYPELDVDDNVKIYKTKDKRNKERISVWSDRTYTIERISISHNLMFYKLEGLGKEYLRHELLKVSCHVWEKMV